jgi:hypothetical protein
MSRELLSPDHPHYYIITLLIRLTFHIFHPHRHTSVTNCKTVSPYTPVWCHYPASTNTTEVTVLHRLSERRHICLLLHPPHIPSWVTSNNSQRLLLLVVTNIPMNRPTTQIEGNSSHCSEKRNTSRKTRNGLVGSLEILSAFLAEAIRINRASLSLRNILNCQVTFHHLYDRKKSPKPNAQTIMYDSPPRLSGTAGNKQYEAN